MREVFKFFGIVLAMVIGIFIAVDYMGNMDEFIKSGISLTRALRYVLLKIPFMTVLFIPVCILISVLIAFGLMSKHNEILALKTCGISIYYLLKPILLVGFISGILIFSISEIIVPATMSEANRIKMVEIRKKSLVRSKEKNIWIKGNRLITHIKYYNPSGKTIFGITMNFFDKDFKLIKRIDAKKGIFKEGKWFLFKLMEQTLDKGSGGYLVTFHDEKAGQLDLLPEDLKRVAKKSEEMSFRELFAYVKKVEKEGYDAAAFRVDLHAKTAFPFICIIMGLIGTGIAARAKISKGIAVGITIGIGMAFLYWIIYSFCLSLGYGEMLPPVIAAWTTNLIFLCVGILTIQHAE